MAIITLISSLFHYIFTYAYLKIFKIKSNPTNIFLFILAIYVTNLVLSPLVFYVIRSFAIGESLILTYAILGGQDFAISYIFARIVLRLSYKHSFMITLIPSIISIFSNEILYFFLNLLG